MNTNHRDRPPSPRLTFFLGGSGDRNARAAAGVEGLGAALEGALAILGQRVGRAGTPLRADWATELEAARAGLEALAQAICEVLEGGDFPVTVMGRCAAALATLPAVARARPDAAVIWLDAHGDCNLPATSATGYLGGLVLTGAAGRWQSGLGGDLDLARVILVGARDLDPPERALVDAGTLRLVEPGADLTGRLRSALAGRPAYVHLDCDVLDAGLVPTEYQTPGGLAWDELAAVFACLTEVELVGLEIAEFEGSWPDGAPADPDSLVGAIKPVLATLKSRDRR